MFALPPTALCQRLPNEITEMIIIALPFQTLLKLEMVSKTWKIFIRGNIYTSETCFRRPKNSSGQAKNVPLATSSEPLRLAVYDPYNYLGVFRSRTSTAFTLHPLLQKALGTSILPTGICPIEIFINARLLFELTSVLIPTQEHVRASWRDMAVTYPPVVRIELKISQCVRERGYVERRENFSYCITKNSAVTFEDLFQALLANDMPHWATTMGERDAVEMRMWRRNLPLWLRT